MRFDVLPADIDERASERDPVRLAEGLALRKARAIAINRGDDARPVIAADTLVVLEGRALGKPADAGEATAMLSSLRGRTHEVITGVAVLAGVRAAADHARTLVTMRPYGDAEIKHYVASGAPFDKAGGYAIQDPQFAPVERCDGCECSVIGLPLWTVGRLLRTAAGIDVDEPAYDRCAACPLSERA